MKNQYFGDKNDDRKYGLLRALTRLSGLKVGMCWLLTDDDRTGDGQLRDDLNWSDRWRAYDPELFDTLQSAQRTATTPSVAKAREWAIIPKACYFEAGLLDSLAALEKYFQAAYQSLQECPLIFLDFPRPGQWNRGGKHPLRREGLRQIHLLARNGGDIQQRPLSFDLSALPPSAKRPFHSIPG